MSGLIIVFLWILFVLWMGKLERRSEERHRKRNPPSLEKGWYGSDPNTPKPPINNSRDGYRPMEHLVVTARGEQWVSERLPKDDYRVSDLSNFGSRAPSVYTLISKPAGYRLVAGYHMTQDDEGDDLPDD
jgi:hypothetical protein